MCLGSYFPILILVSRGFPRASFFSTLTNTDLQGFVKDIRDTDLVHFIRIELTALTEAGNLANVASNQP